MDVPLEFLGSGVQETNRSCFNPCFNGCASRIPSNSLLYPIMACFNPCFNGCASRIPPLHAVFVSLRVSILVLMDAPLEYVSITTFISGSACFNPCFNGCASRISQRKSVRLHPHLVSILVLMDVPLELH